MCENMLKSQSVISGVKEDGMQYSCDAVKLYAVCTLLSIKKKIHK